MAEIDLSERKGESDPQDREEVEIEAEVRRMLGPEASGRVPPLMMMRFIRGCESTRLLGFTLPA